MKKGPKKGAEGGEVGASIGANEGANGGAEESAEESQRPVKDAGPESESGPVSEPGLKTSAHAREKPLVPLAKEGYPFIAGAVVVTAIAWSFGSGWLFHVLCVLTAFILWFFRDPERAIPGKGTPGGESLLVSPADGRVIKVERATEDKFLKAETLRISIFMNVFDVHVNRAPVGAKVISTKYNPGKFFNASLDKASMYNEQNSFLMESTEGRRLVLTQIAGLIARRIVPYVTDGAVVSRGERIGMIRFGSRVDLYLPTDTEALVNVGDRVYAGSSLLARW